MEELKKLFEFVDLEDEETANLYLKIIFNKYKFDVIKDYLNKNTDNIEMIYFAPDEYFINTKNFSINYSTETKKLNYYKTTTYVRKTK